MNGPGSDEERITGLVPCEKRKPVVQFLFREEKLVMLLCKPEPAETLLGYARLFHMGTAHLRLFSEYFFQEPFLLL